jgi:hypothetical protein
MKMARAMDMVLAAAYGSLNDHGARTCIGSRTSSGSRFAVARAAILALANGLARTLAMVLALVLARNEMAEAKRMVKTT